MTTKQLCSSWTFSINFTLRSNKQWLLVYVLLQVCAVKIDVLASMMGVSEQMINNVMQGRELFDKSQSLRLVQYFCLACGD